MEQAMRSPVVPAPWLPTAVCLWLIAAGLPLTAQGLWVQSSCLSSRLAAPGLCGPNMASQSRHLMSLRTGREEMKLAQLKQ